MAGAAARRDPRFAQVQDGGPAFMLRLMAFTSAVAPVPVDVGQLTRYLELITRDPLLVPVQGIFAAQEIKPQAQVLVTDRGIGRVVVDYDKPRGMGLELTPF